jgi:hypothetical protein
MVGAAAATALATASRPALQTSTRRRPSSSAIAPIGSSAVASPRLIALNVHVSPATPACSDRAVSPTVVTGAEKTARTSSVAEAATVRVKAGEAACPGVRGSIIEPNGSRDPRFDQ